MKGIPDHDIAKELSTKQDALAFLKDSGITIKLDNKEYADNRSTIVH